MKFVQLLSLILVIANVFAKEISNNVIATKRDKRQNERWTWEENRAQINVNNHSTEPPVENTTEPSYCTLNNRKPNFDSPGRRISEIKCYEYIWEMKNRADVALWEAECWKETTSEEDGPSYAIGGRDTIPGEFPHMGALGWRAVVGTWIFKCGSFLISPKFMLTAAHCSQASGDSAVVNVRPEIVRLGDKNIIDDFANDQLPVDVNITTIIVHPKFVPPKKYYDIAIIELETEVKFDKFVQPACLWTKHDTSSLGTKASLTGWGYVDSARQKTSPELQAAEVDIIDTDQCNTLLRPAWNRHFNGLQSHQLCAGVLAGGVDACQGDSGGPLQVKIPLPITSEGIMSYVIGVTSFGVGCARPNTPGVYTRVSSFIDWIEDIVWPGRS